MIQEFVQEVTNTVQKNLKGVHTAFPGVIITFDPDTGLANVQPTMKYRKPDRSTIDYPQITGVPVVFPQSMGQQATIAYPIKPGDGCLVIVAEQSIDYWMYGQETETDLAFDLTDSICIVGLFVPANSVMKDACNNNAIIVDVKGTRITVKDKHIKSEAGESIIEDVSGTKITIVPGKVQIDATQIVLNGDVSVNGGIVATKDIIAESRVSGAHHTHTGDSGGTTSQPN